MRRTSHTIAIPDTGYSGSRVKARPRLGPASRDAFNCWAGGHIPAGAAQAVQLRLGENL